MGWSSTSFASPTDADCSAPLKSAKNSTYAVEMKINIHRYYNKVALSLGGQPTVYVEQELASQLAAALTEAVVDIEHREFTKSRFESRELVPFEGCRRVIVARREKVTKGEALKARLRHHVTGAIERGESVAIEEKPLPWHVVAVSTNHGSFGHKSVLVIREDGEGRELLLQAYVAAKLPVRGDILEVLPQSEVQPRKLPTTTPKIAKQIISELKKSL